MSRHDPVGFASAQRRRQLIAAVAALAVGTGVWASATSLSVTQSGNLSAGQQSVTSCDSDGVTSTLGSPTYNASTGKYEISQVTISGVDATNCNGKTLAVTVASSGNADLGHATASISSGAGASYTVTLSANPDAATVDHVVVAIYG